MLKLHANDADNNHKASKQSSPPGLDFGAIKLTWAWGGKTCALWISPGQLFSNLSSIRKNELKSKMGENILRRIFIDIIEI